MPHSEAPKRVREAENQLQEWLQQAALKPGSALPPERDLAASLGLTHYALNRAAGRLVDLGHLERRGRRLHVPMASSPAVATGPRRIGILHRESYEADLRGLEEAAAAHRAILVHRSWDTPSRFRRELGELPRQEVCGALVFPPFGRMDWGEELVRLEKVHLPVVICGNGGHGRYTIELDFWHNLRQLLDRLAAFGHREVGFVPFHNDSKSSAEAQLAWRALCLAGGFESSTDRIAPASPDFEARITLLQHLLHNQWSMVTGLVFHERDLAPRLMEVLRKQGTRVPRDLSFLVHGDSPATRTAEPPLGGLDYDYPHRNRLALALLSEILDEATTLGKLPPPRRLVYGLNFNPRGSLGTNPRGDVRSVEHKYGDARFVWSGDTVKRRAEAAEINGRPYPGIQGIHREKFHPLPLTPVFNRAWGHRRGWLGDEPLKHFAGGRAVRFHGVEFNLGGADDTPGVLVMRSQKNQTGSGQPLPQEVEIPIPASGKVRTIYILHACAFALHPRRIATYTIKLRRRPALEIPVIPAGRAESPDAERTLEALERSPNIQDWWPELPQSDFPTARRVVITGNGDPLEYERYLYTLEIPLPEPGIVEAISISSDPEEPGTLGVLAVTLLQA